MALYVALFSLLAAFNVDGAHHVSGDLSSYSCEFYARKLGQPLDGWRVLHDTGDGPNCIREPVDLRCAGRQYYDPVRPPNVDTKFLAY